VGDDSPLPAQKCPGPRSGGFKVEGVGGGGCAFTPFTHPPTQVERYPTALCIPQSQVWGNLPCICPHLEEGVVEGVVAVLEERVVIAATALAVLVHVAARLGSVGSSWIRCDRWSVGWWSVVVGWVLVGWSHTALLAWLHAPPPPPFPTCPRRRPCRRPFSLQPPWPPWRPDPGRRRLRRRPPRRRSRCVYWLVVGGGSVGCWWAGPRRTHAWAQAAGAGPRVRRCQRAEGTGGSRPG
jgi:hypothetical protein